MSNVIKILSEAHLGMRNKQQTLCRVAGIMSDQRTLYNMTLVGHYGEKEDSNLVVIMEVVE